MTLNRLIEPLSINRFRSNIVFTGGEAYEENALENFTINSVDFYGVKLCDRCAVTTIDREKAIKENEPLKTLATYRMFNNNVYLGQNLLHDREGTIKIDDIIKVKKRKQRINFE